MYLLSAVSFFIQFTPMWRTILNRSSVPFGVRPWSISTRSLRLVSRLNATSLVGQQIYRYRAIGLKVGSSKSRVILLVFMVWSFGMLCSWNVRFARRKTDGEIVKTRIKFGSLCSACCYSLSCSTWSLGNTWKLSEYSYEGFMSDFFFVQRVLFHHWLPFVFVLIVA